jgi:serine/threonine protein kinase
MIGFIKRIINGWRDYPHKEHTIIHQQYLIKNFIGQGSFGTAYCCADLQNGGCLVLVKQSRASKGRRAVDMLDAERRVLSIIDCNGIPKVLDYFSWQGAQYLVTEFVPGKTLENMIFDNHETIDESQCVNYAIQTLQLLVVVHRNQFVHLDVRLPNVIIDNQRVHLIDFGLVRAIGDHPDVEPYEEGKLAYRHLAEPQSDLYAVGHMMLFMLYTTFERTESTNVVRELSWEEELAISDDLKTVLRKLLKIDSPYQHAEEAVAALQQIKTGIPARFTADNWQK